MDTKLTLRLNSDVIERAKKYAHDNKVSLSKLIETFLESVTQPSNNEPKVTPLVESLIGVIEDLPENFDYKKEYRDYLEDKYK